MQPSHETTDMRWAEARVGPDRIKGAYAWATLQKSGARLAFGTDYPVEPINPFRGLYACVTRELPEGGPAGGWQPQEKISLDDCIRDYTIGSAYAQFEEGKKGQLKNRPIRRLHDPLQRPHENSAGRLHQHQSPPHRSRRPHRLPISIVSRLTVAKTRKFKSLSKKLRG